MVRSQACLVVFAGLCSQPDLRARREQLAHVTFIVARQVRREQISDTGDHCLRLLGNRAFGCIRKGLRSLERSTDFAVAGIHGGCEIVRQSHALGGV